MQYPIPQPTLPWNLVLNGGLDYQQSMTFNGSTSLTFNGPNAADLYSFDQFKGNSQGGGTAWTITQGSGGPNSAHYAKFSTSAGEGLLLYQPIEAQVAQALSNGQKTVTLQTQVQMPTGATTVKLAIVKWTGTADTLTKLTTAWAAGASTDPTLNTNYTIIATSTLSATTSWLPLSVTAQIQASINNLVLMIWYDKAASGSSELDIAEWALTENSAPVTWEPGDPALEFDRCRRFLELLGGNISTEFLSPAGVGASGTTANAVLAYYKKRIAPTLSYGAAAGFILNLSLTLTSIATNSGGFTGPQTALVLCTVSGGGITGGNIYFLSTTSASGMILIDARL